MPASHPAIKLVAIDLDGTLLNDRKEVADHVVDAIKGLPPRGVRVVIASARPPRSVRHVYHRLGLDTWQINYNGALIWDEAKKKPVAHRPMPGKLVRQVIDQARDLFDDVLVSCEILDRWFTDKFDQTYTTETGRLFRPDVICPIEQFTGVPVTKLMLLGDARLIDRLEGVLAEAYREHLTVVRTDPELLQLMDKRVSKAVALRAVAKHYNVPMNQVMAIGDAPNDVGMLQLAGVGVAMANAHKVVKNVADWIAPSNNDHGVHAALVRYGLCPKA
jgi:hypothetical protein